MLPGLEDVTGPQEFGSIKTERTRRREKKKKRRKEREEKVMKVEVKRVAMKERTEDEKEV